MDRISKRQGKKPHPAIRDHLQSGSTIARRRKKGTGSRPAPPALLPLQRDWGRVPVPFVRERAGAGACPRDPRSSSERLNHREAEEKGDWLPARTARAIAFAERLGPGACPPFP